MNRFPVVAMCLVWLFPVAVLAGDSCRFDAGPLALEIHISKTANLFHAVDQLSQWSEFCHKQYVEYFQKVEGGVSKADEDLLAQHRAIRKTHGWGGGLEQTFYTALDLDAALASAVKQNRLSKEEAETERRIFTHFQSRVESLMAHETPTLTQFVQEVQAKRSDLAAFADNASHFVGGAKLTIPVYLMANPHVRNCGGGFNGGRLTLEIAKNYDMYPTLLHELFHAFLRTKQELIVSAARSAPGLDEQTLSEGLAYAYNPGLVQAGNSGEKDVLLSSVAGYMTQGSSLNDTYTRFNTYGLAIRPLLKDALFDKHQTLDAFLPRATDAWLVLNELSKALSTARDSSNGVARMPQQPTRTQPRHRLWYSAGPGWEELGQVARSQNGSLKSLNHGEQQYKMILSESQPGSTIVLLFALNHPDKDIPQGYEDLLPTPWRQVEETLEKGRTVEVAGKSRDRHIVLLAAPTKSTLEELIRKTKLLPHHPPDK